MNAKQLILELKKGKVITYNKGGAFQKSFKQVAEKYYYSFNNTDWNPTFIDVEQKVKNQYGQFTLGGI